MLVRVVALVLFGICVSGESTPSPVSNPCPDGWNFDDDNRCFTSFHWKTYNAEKIAKWRKSNENAQKECESLGATLAELDTQDAVDAAFKGADGNVIPFGKGMLWVDGGLKSGGSKEEKDDWVITGDRADTDFTKSIWYTGYPKVDKHVCRGAWKATNRNADVVLLNVSDCDTNKRGWICQVSLDDIDDCMAVRNDKAECRKLRKSCKKAYKDSSTKGTCCQWRRKWHNERDDLIGDRRMKSASAAKGCFMPTCADNKKQKRCEGQEDCVWDASGDPKCDSPGR